MIVKAIKTKKVTPDVTNILSIIDESISDLQNNSIVAITSKIISIAEGRVVAKEKADKNKLIEQEADYFITPESTNYPFYLTITKNILIPNAGIDESNSTGGYVLWPKDPQLSANSIRTFLQKKFSITNVGVVITDSTTSPLRWGTKGIVLAYSGFAALNDYVGTLDLFGRTLEVTKANVADALASAAVLTMGEGNEQTPLAVITDIPNVVFQDRNPTEEELKDLVISMDDDIYAPILKAAKWQKSHQL